MTQHVIASQFGDEFDARLRAAHPDALVLSLPRQLQWPLRPDVDVLLAVPYSAESRRQPEPAGWPWGVRWVQLVSTGIDNYPAWLLQRPHVTTAHATAVQPISDYVIACVLQHALRLRDRTVRTPDQWRFVSAPALAGSTLGLFGFGAIGRGIARKALALGLRVLALRRSPEPLAVEGVERAASIAELLERSDHVVLVAPGTAATRHVINAESLEHARSGLHLINVSRGSLVDQEALHAALADGRIGFASLDVADPEPLPAGHWLYSHARVQLTSHTCAISPQVHDALLAKVLTGLQALDDGALPVDLVNLRRGY